MIDPLLPLTILTVFVQVVKSHVTLCLCKLLVLVSVHPFKHLLGYVTDLLGCQAGSQCAALSHTSHKLNLCYLIVI